MPHPNTPHIQIGNKANRGHVLTKSEIAANRQRLAEKIMAATTAIVLPPGQLTVPNGRLAKESVLMPRGVPGSTKLFELVEMRTDPPPPRADKKYIPLTSTILSAKINGDGHSEWMRFLFGSRRAANGANTHLSKKARPAWRSDGHDAETALVPADADKCWLYVRRVRVIGAVGDGGDQA